MNFEFGQFLHTLKLSVPIQSSVYTIVFTPSTLRYEGIGQIQNWYVILNLGFHLNINLCHSVETIQLQCKHNFFFCLYSIMYCFHWEAPASWTTKCTRRLFKVSILNLAKFKIDKPPCFHSTCWCSQWTNSVKTKKEIWMYTWV